MKSKFFLLLVLSGVVSGVYAQNKNALRFGVNGAFWGMGDVSGVSVYGEYERELLPFVSAVAQFSSGYSDQKEEYLSSVLASRSASLSLRFIPFPWKVINRLKLDAGFLYQHFAETSVNYSSNPSRPVLGTSNYRSNLYGLLFGVNINVLQTGRHLLGIRGEMRTSFVNSKFNCDGLQAGVFYGVRF